MADRARWWATAALLAAAAAVWALATPLLTGPDEADHSIRAAAAIRGHVLGAGADLFGSPNVFAEVPVPEAYAGAPGVGICFVDYPGDDEGFGAALEQPCVPMGDGTRTVLARTNQYRTQPTYHWLVGAGSLVPGSAGVHVMRLLSGLASAALLATALAAAARDRSGLLALATFAATTPVVVWLAGQVNAGGFEAAAAIAAWTATTVLVARADEVEPRDVARAGIALTALTLTRGLSPGFAVAVVAAVALARPDAARRLASRRDVRRWGAAALASIALSVVWLAVVTIGYPIAARPGTGLGHAVGQAWYFTTQTVAVFGSNDVVLPSWITVAWLAVVAAVVVRAWPGLTARARLVVAGVAASSLVLDVAAEGFSVPPIGYFWQGRYTIPLVVGVPILAAGLRAPAERDRRLLAGGAGVLAALHGVALAGALKHFAGRGDGTLGYVDAFRHPRWEPPLLPLALWPLVLVVAVGAAARVATAAPPRTPPPPPRSPAR